MYLESSVPTVKMKGDLVNMQLSLPQRMQVTYGLDGLCGRGRGWEDLGEWH